MAGTTWLRFLCGSTHLSHDDDPSLRVSGSRVAQDSLPETQFVLTVTHNGGATWQQSLLPPDGTSFMGFTCPTTTTCMVPAVNGYNPAPGYMFTTVDGGQSWTSLPLPGGDVSLVQLSCASYILSASRWNRKITRWRMSSISRPMGATTGPPQPFRPPSSRAHIGSGPPRSAVLSQLSLHLSRHVYLERCSEHCIHDLQHRRRRATWESSTEPSACPVSATLT